MKKVLGSIGIALLVLVIVFAVGKNSIIKGMVSAGVKAMTGLKLDIAKLNVGVMNTLVDIEGLKLYNPPSFTDELMVDMPEIYIDYDLGAFLKKKVHVNKVRINVQEFTVIRNEKGELNLDSLKVVQDQQKPDTEKKASKPMDLQIDVLELVVGTVYYKDYSRGGKPSVQTFRLNLDERFENITDPRDISGIILAKVMMNTTIGALANFDVGPIAEGVAGTLSSATEVMGDAADMAVEATKEIGGAVGDVGKEAGAVLKKLIPFGGNGE